MDKSKKLYLTVFASSSLVLLFGCQQKEEVEQREKAAQVVRETKTDTSAPVLEEYAPKQKAKRATNLTENPRLREESAAKQARQSLRNRRRRLIEEKRMSKQQPSFSQLDTNQDGYISQAEAQAFKPLALHFRMLDKNKDGRVDPTEFAHFQSMQMHSFEQGGGGDYGRKYMTEPANPGKGPELPAAE